jgi:hypothetical protein
MAEGRLSFSKVRAMTRVADGTNEDFFLNVAVNGTATHVEQLVRTYRRAKESQELFPGKRSNSAISRCGGFTSPMVRSRSRGGCRQR